MAEDRLKILFASSELNPIAKVGGLADVAGALPQALKKKGVDIRIIIPRYEIIDTQKYPLKLIKSELPVSIAKKEERVNLYETLLPNSAVRVYLIEHPEYLTKNGIYFEKSAFVGSFEEIKRFLFFSKAVVDILPELDFRPEIVHCQDWHTALIPSLLKAKAQKEIFYQEIKTLFTIHNLANQGRWRADEVLNFIDLQETDFPWLKRRDAEGNFNLIQQGILSSDIINTVSKTYAKEVLTAEFGEGLEADLKERQAVLFGILNGIDLEFFNPEKDPYVAANYNQDQLKLKQRNKLDLQKRCQLTTGSQIPVLGFIGRLTNQKGIELLPPIIDELIKNDIQLVILGVGQEKFEQMASEMHKKYPKQVFTKLAFDMALAQKIYAGADIFLMPSRFEPCGLGQMIAMRYGTPPVVRTVGGLKDTVSEFDPKTGQGTGFTFKNYKSQELRVAIKKALEIFKDKKKWQTLIKNDMSQDFSWDKSSQEYLKLYNQLIKK